MRLADDNLVEKALALVGPARCGPAGKAHTGWGGSGRGICGRCSGPPVGRRNEPAVAAQLGSDVPFCLAGGRARVSGVGERVDALPFEDRRFVLLLPPISVDTGAVYRAWDYLRSQESDRLERTRGPGNDLEEAASRRLPRS